MEHGRGVYKMPRYTDNYNFILPELNENYSVQVANTNNISVDTILKNKVDKQEGKVLSTNDFTDEYKIKLNGLENYDDSALAGRVERVKQATDANTENIETLQSDVSDLDENKVDKVAGKGLSTNDYTDEDKAQLETNTSDIEALKEENADLKEQLKDRQNNELKGTVSGTEIDLTDSADSRVNEIGLSGNSVQETTEGYQLFDKNGTMTNDNRIATNTGGSYSASGYSISPFIEIKSSTVYTIVSGITSYFCWYDENKTYISGGGTTSGLTSPSNAKYVKFDFQTSNIDNIMLYEGSSVKPYEPYTNGASPNPDYEQPIKGCGDNINLTNVESGGYSQTTGQKITDGTLYRSENYIEITGTNYILAQNQVGKTIRIFLYDTNKNFLSSLVATNGIITISNSSAKYFTWQGGTAAFSNTMEGIKVQKGSTATPYSPYGMGCITEKIVNKNLFDINKYPFYTTTAYNGSGAHVSWSGYCGIAHYFPIKPNRTYTFSNNLGKYIYFGLVYYDENKEIISCTAGNYIQTFTTPENCKYIRFAMQSDTLPTWVQIEEGSASTDYEEHQEQTHTIPTQQPMRSIGTTRDLFFKNTTDSPYYNSSLVANKWYEMHKIVKRQLLSSSNWALNNSQDWYYITLYDANKEWNTDFASNYFIKNSWQMSDRKGICIGNRSQAVLGIGANEFESVDALKTFLDNNEVFAYYESTTPTYLLCTDEQVQALEAYSKARTYKNVTHLYSEDEVPGYVDMTYYKDLETVINNLTTRVEVIESEV